MTSLSTILMLFCYVFRVNSGVLDSELDQILDELNTDQNRAVTPFSLQPIENNSTPKNPYEVPKGVECPHFCVPFFQCKDGKLNTNGVNLIDIRLNDGPCGNALIACCKKEFLTDQPTNLTNPNSDSKEESVTRGCGYRSPNGTGFQITGTKENEAQYAEFPWMVSIHSLPGDPNGRPTCGGALIHPQAVITAAHCIVGIKKRWKIRAGEWDILQKIELYPVQEVEVESFTIHENYYSGALFNDIAFLKLKQPVALSKNVDTICLPPQNYKHIPPKRCFFTGWGKNKFGKEGVYQGILKKIDLPVIGNEECQDLLRKTRLGMFFELHNSFMCAGGEEGKDACNGDGGSPLVCPWHDDLERYYFAGMAAWGIGCAQRDIPGVYVDVAVFRSWIDAQMTIHRLPTIFYERNNPFQPRITNKK